MTLLFAGSLYSLLTVCAVAIVSFGAGLLFKSALVRKQRKRILNLENEMLANHARILELEKSISDVRKEKNGVPHDFDLTARKTEFEKKIF